MIEKIILAVTFVYGVVFLLTMTKIFNKNLVGLIDSLWPTEVRGIWKWLDMVIFYLSLVYQAYYWLFK